MFRTSNEEAAHMLLATLKSGSKEAKQMASDQIVRMGKLLDGKVVKESEQAK